MQRRCAHKNCPEYVEYETKYCATHRGTCPDCGKVMHVTSTRCASCSARMGHAKRDKYAFSFTMRAAWDKHKQTAGYINELKQIIRDYEDAWLNGFHPSLCQDALSKLRPQLEAMKATHVTPTT